MIQFIILFVILFYLSYDNLKSSISFLVILYILPSKFLPLEIDENRNIIFIVTLFILCLYHFFKRNCSNKLKKKNLFYINIYND